MHVYDCTILPNTRYHVFTDCSRQLPGLFSAGTSVTTWRWGDVNGSGSVTLVDFSLVNDAADGNLGGLTIPNLDLAPCRPDGTIDSLDVAAVQSALGGNPFPCPAPCVGGERSSACPEIPAASTWGLMILLMTMATCGTLLLRRTFAEAPSSD